MKVSNLYISFILIALMATASAAADTGDSCSTNEDCPDLNDCQANICVHKELFPITFREVGGTFFILLLNAIMTAGGVGAGAAYVPYIMLIFQHTLKQSIYVAYACVFGGGLGNLVNIITLKNPANKRYMINFDVNMIILPALMIGVITGVLISRMLPPFMTNLILLFVLGYSIFKNFHKLKANLAKEKKQKTVIKPEESDKIIPKETVPQEQEQEYAKIPEKKEAIAFSLAQVEEDSPGSTLNSVPIVKTISIDPNGSPTEINTALTLKKDSQNDLQAQKKELILQRELRFPFHKLRELLINVVIIIVIGLIRGSKNFKPVVGVEWTCGWDFIWFGLAIFAFLLALVRSVHLVQKWQKEKLEVGYEFLPQEPILDKRRTIKLAIGAIVAGIIGALVALGGAMIMGPIILDMNIPPAFSATTTGVFMIFSMFNATFQPILDGNLTWQELVWFLPLSFVFSYVSSKIVNWYVKKTGKQSTVIMTVMVGAIMGFLCLLAIFINALVENFDSQVQFQPLC